MSELIPTDPVTGYSPLLTFPSASKYLRLLIFSYFDGLSIIQKLCLLSTAERLLILESNMLQKHQLTIYAHKHQSIKVLKESYLF